MASASPEKNGKSSIVTLQVMRGIAAVAVVYYHVYIIMMEPQYGAHVVLKESAKFGFLGVNFFFILSGFIIFKAHSKDVGVPSSVWLYSYKRITRVYPAYWVYLTGFIGAAALGLGHPDFSWAPMNIVSSYLLVDLVDNLSLPLKVAWTLLYEIRFYFLFLLMLVLGWKALWLFWMWGAAIVVAYLAGWQDVPDILSLWNAYFIAGMIGFLVIDRIPRGYGGLLLGLGVVLFALFAYLGSDISRIADLDRSNPHLHFLLVPTFWALIMGPVLLERDHSLRMPGFLRMLGDASYSIYLVHSAAISLVLIVLVRIDLLETLGLLPTFTIAFVMGTVAGVVAYYVVEKPLITLLKRLVR